MSPFVIVIENQNLYDIAVQEYGNVQAVFDLAFANGLSVTDNITPGQKLTLPSTEHYSKEIATYFRGKGILVATNYIELVNENYEFPQGEFPISF